MAGLRKAVRGATGLEMLVIWRAKRRGARRMEVGIRSRFTKSQRFARATSSRLHQRSHSRIVANALRDPCLLYTSDAADD